MGGAGLVTGTVFLVLDAILQPLRLAEHTGQFLCSSGSDERGELKALEGYRVSSKSPSRVQDGDEGVDGRNKREVFPR